MIILGINAYHADSSAAIFVDGNMISATEEERFRRVKHWAGFPSQATAFCMKEAGVTLYEVDWITIGRDPSAKISIKLLFLLQDPFSGYETVKTRMQNRKDIASLEEEFSRAFNVSAALINPEIKHIEHQRGHMVSAVFASPFEQA